MFLSRSIRIHLALLGAPEPRCELFLLGLRWFFLCLSPRLGFSILKEASSPGLGAADRVFFQAKSCGFYLRTPARCVASGGLSKMSKERTLNDKAAVDVI